MTLNLRRPYKMLVGKDQPSIFTQDGIMYHADGRVIGPAGTIITKKTLADAKLPGAGPAIIAKDLPAEPKKELPEAEPKVEAKPKKAKKAKVK